MARIFSSGFELGSITSGVEWIASSGGSIQSTIVRSGGFAYRVNALSSGSAKRLRNAIGALSHIYVRLYVRFDTFPSAENRFFIISDNATPTTTPRVYMTVDNAGRIRLYDDDGQIGSASAVLSTGTWYRFGIKLDRSGSAGSHIVDGRINGTSFASSTTRDVGGNIYNLHIGANLNNEANTAGDWTFDDIAINDSTGSNQNSFPGEGSIIHLQPNAAGDNTAWSNAYTEVDEVTPDDAATLIASNTLGQISDFNLAASGIGTDKDITLAAVLARFNGAGASANASFVVRCKASAGGTVEEGTTITPSSATWRTNEPGGAGVKPSLTMYDLPGSSTNPWTPAYLDSAQIGVRLSAANTNGAQVTSLQLLVEYRPQVRDGKMLQFM